MPNVLPENRWSRWWASCAECGTTERGHVSKGLCTTCYDRLRRTGTSEPEKACERWSRDHDSCTECGKTAVAHSARGLCRNCASEAWRRENPEKVRESNRRYWRGLSADRKRDLAPKPRRERTARPEPVAPPKTAPKPFPRLKALCRIVPVGEVGHIVGYSEVYDEWRVLTEGGESLLWEPCDLVEIPLEVHEGGEPLRRAA